MRSSDGDGQAAQQTRARHTLVHITVGTPVDRNVPFSSTSRRIAVLTLTGAVAEGATGGAK
jgi:hypothetical protein